jgi:DHA2 family multidrug resistance protein
LFYTRVLVAIGVVAFSIGAYFMSHLTLESGQGDVIMSIIVQGVGFAFLFVPLTTVALSNVPRARMADATGLNSLSRQVGGAIGLAIFATLLERYTTVARASVAVHVSAVDPMTQQRLSMLQRSFAMQGMPPPVAKGASVAAVARDVAQQATVLAFDRIFLLAGVLFLFVLPLLIFLKQPKMGQGGGGKSEVHLE